MVSANQTAAIIVGAGFGQRFGQRNKIISPLAGKPLITYCFDAIQAAAMIDIAIVVVASHTFEQTEHLLAEGHWSKITKLVIGGNRRQDSVASGISALPAETEMVVLHDAARPFAPPELFNQTVTLAHRTGAAIAAIPVTDTIKRVQNGLITTTVPRDDLWAAQTPQTFNRRQLQAALSRAAQASYTVTDEAALFEWLGWPVAIVEGTRQNMKLTYPDDLAIATALLQTHQIIDRESPQ